MIYKNKIAIIFSFLTLSFISSAQVGSPYSQFGFGDSQTQGFEQSKGMGGIGVGLRSNNQLNPINPASYTALDSLSVIYAFGFNSGYNDIESKTDKLRRTDTRFGYFTLGFKGNKFWGSSFGVAPATKVDYTYRMYEESSENGDINYFFHGSGGLNKAYWSNAFKITPNLSVGLNVSYIFGAINKVTTAFFASDYVDVYVDTKMKTDNTKYKQQRNISDFTFNYGVQYQFDLKDNSSLVLGAVYQNAIDLNTEETFLGGTIANIGISEGFYEDLKDYELSAVAIDTSGIKGSVSMPSSFGIGLTYNHKNKILAGFDITQQAWSNVSNSIYDASKNDMLSAKAGIEFTPDDNSVNHYYERVHYRFGGHYTKTQLEVNNSQVTDYGISFGVGLPLRNTNTTFNISYEFGQRGSIDKNLLKETYGILSINLSLSDIWFVKRKFK